jgi:hypothetical protein
MADRIDFEWNYQPADFFEARHCYADADSEIVADAGLVRATSADTNVPATEERLTEQVQAMFRARQVLVRRGYSLDGPRIIEHVAGKRHITLRVEPAQFTITAGSADIIVTDAAGAVVRDSRHERIAEHSEFVNLLTAKAGGSQTLRSVLESYARSVADPEDELVHLYEVRDTIAAHFGGEQQARGAVGISATEWQAIGRLANVEPVHQGRHRGKHPGVRRSATDDELNQARSIVRGWIEQLAKTF